MPANASSEEHLAPKQEKLIAALLAGHTIVQSATIAGCNEKTAHTWLKLPHVAQAYRDAQNAVFEHAVQSLQLEIDDAKATLRAIHKDPEAPHAARVRAAQILLEQSIEIHKIGALEQEIAELKKALEAKGH